jgi:hypothetical protein
MSDNVLRMYNNKMESICDIMYPNNEERKMHIFSINTKSHKNNNE